MPAPVGDAAGGDHRHGDGVDDLRHERERADLRLDAVGEEHAAVAAGLEALGDDRVAAALLEPDRLVDGGRRGDDLRPGGAHPVEEGCVGQAEVEADDLRAQLLDERAEGGVERRAVAGRGRRRRVEAELAVVGREPGLPRRLAPGVGRGRAVAEEVDVDRPVGPLADDAELGAEPSASSSAQGSEPRPPASATATAMSASTAPAIGAWTIGSSMPKRSRMRRSGHIAVTSPRRPARGRTRCRRGRAPRSWSSRPRRRRAPCRGSRGPSPRSRRRR